jgi:pyruvate/2-oxoglutarate dehydrogenase complex dihydrolipoamide acyltransferase (E2) component
MRTLKLPDELDDSVIETYHVSLGQQVQRGMPIVTVKVDGRPTTVPSDADGVVLYHFLNQDMRCAGGAPLVLLGGPGELMGYDRNHVRCMRVMLLRKCEECGGSQPVNGWVERLRCTACGTTSRQPADFWKSIVADAVAEAPPRGAYGTNVLAGAHGACTVQVWETPPLCRACSTLLPWNAVVDAWNRARPDAPVEIPCAGCGEKHRARPAPPAAVAVMPQLVFLLAETSADATRAVEAAKPVVFNCPSCTASLKIDGEKRIVSCKFCDSEVYLPEDLWRHLHPSSRRGRWWLLLRP